MNKKPKDLSTDFLRSLQASLEDPTTGTDSPIEAINRLRKAENPTNMEDLRKRIEDNAGPFSPKVVFPGESAPPRSSAPSPQKPPEEKVTTRVVYKGHRYNGDFFSCMAVALIELNNPKVNEVMKAWAFILKDLDGNQVFPPTKVVRFSRPRNKRKKK